MDVPAQSARELPVEDPGLAPPARDGSHLRVEQVGRIAGSHVEPATVVAHLRAVGPHYRALGRRPLLATPGAAAGMHVTHGA